MQRKLWIIFVVSTLVCLYWIFTPVQFLYQLIALILFLTTFYFKKLTKLNFIFTLLLSIYANDTAIFLSLYFIYFRYVPYIGLLFGFLVLNKLSFYLLFILIAMLIYYESFFLSTKNTLYQERDLIKKEHLLLRDIHQQSLSLQQTFLDESIHNERTRISCEIHDHSGHLISSSIMQIAALKLSEKDSTKIQMLEDIQKTLQDAMQNIRLILHNSLVVDELKLELQKIIQQYPNIQTTLQYEYHSKLSLSTIMHLSAITKEAFTNVIKHSNATKVYIHCYENSQFFVYRFEDNGTTQKKTNQGIGLYSMKLRATALNALLHISDDYQIHIRMKKEKL